MPIDIAPKQQINIKPIYNGRKKQTNSSFVSENGTTLNRKVVLIKRSKSTGIVLKQKKQKTTYIKHHHKPVSTINNNNNNNNNNNDNNKHLLPENIKQSNIGTFILPSEKGLAKDEKIVLAPTPVIANTKTAKSEIANNEIAKKQQQPPITNNNTKKSISPTQLVPKASIQSNVVTADLKNIMLATSGSEMKETTTKEASGTATTSSSTTSSTSVDNSVFSDKKAPLSENTGSIDVVDFNTENLKTIQPFNNHDETKQPVKDEFHAKKTTKPSLKLLNDHSFTKKNGLQSPPISNVNTTANSDVEIFSDEPNTKNNNELNDRIFDNKKLHNENDNNLNKISDTKPVTITKKSKTQENNSNNSIRSENELEVKQSLKETKNIKNTKKTLLNTDISRSLSSLKSESVPMTPSYTTSTDNTNTIQTYEQKPLQVFSPKSPKEEEEEVIDDTKLSKKASLLKKKIVQRKNKNSILKLELNDLIENLQLLKKQYDMISNAFGSGIKPTNCELPSIPDSTLDITDVNLTVEDSTSYNRNNNDNDNNNKPALTIKNEISGYYFKRTGTMLYADDEESGLIDSNAFTAKKQKTIPTSISNQQDGSNNNIFMSNINLITDNILNTMPTTVPLKNNNTSDVALNLMTIQDVLQQPDIQPMNSVMGFNENNTYNNLLFNERNNSTSNFDFFLENNENINLDDDVNMDFLNF